MEQIRRNTIIEKKGTNDLILAFNSIAKKFPLWKLILAGNGDIEKGNILIQSLNIQNQVEFHGWVSGISKDNLFKKASIFCLPSYTEGFPMAVLDAWSYGIPVITTPVGGLPDVLINGGNAMVFEPGDIESLANILEKLIIDEALRKKLSEASLQLSQGLFNIATISVQLNELYAQLCNS